MILIDGVGREALPGDPDDSFFERMLALFLLHLVPAVAWCSGMNMKAFMSLLGLLMMN